MTSTGESPSVVVLGLGRMGSALARRLVEGGYQVSAWNRSARPRDAIKSAGVEPLETLADVWAHGDTVLSFLADDSAVQGVYAGDEGVLHSAPVGARIIEMSTISPGASSAVASAAADRAVAYLRSPVSGNPEVLAAGNLSLIVSGNAADFESARPLLERIGKTVRYVGEGEASRVLKLAVNAVLGGTTQLLAESIVLCESIGIDREVLIDVLAGSAVGSPFVSYKKSALIERRYDATFTSAMLKKDLDLAHDIARAERIELPALELLRSLIGETVERGYADQDFLALLPRLQLASGREADAAPGAPPSC